MVANQIDCSSYSAAVTLHTVIQHAESLFCMHGTGFRLIRTSNRVYLCLNRLWVSLNPAPR